MICCSMRLIITFLSVFICLSAFGQMPLVYQGHAHNDYKHKRPLLDALDNGFMSVEADVFLVNGEILVAHTRLGVNQKNSLRALYLDPLRKRVQENGGCVYTNGPQEFVLMIDLKTNGQEMMDKLNEELSEYSELFTVFRGDAKTPGPVRVVLSGGPNYDMVMSYNPRYMSMDESSTGFDRSRNADITPRVSSSYGSIFSWKGRGKIPKDEQEKLVSIVNEAHKYGKRVRFWATPQKEAIWKAQLDAGVDWLNIDDLARFRRFYLKYVKQHNLHPEENWQPCNN